MTIKRLRQLLGKKAESKTDQELQKQLNQIMPLVRLCVKRTEKHLNLTNNLDSVQNGTSVQLKVRSKNDLFASNELAEHSERSFLQKGATL